MRSRKSQSTLTPAGRKPGQAGNVMLEFAVSATVLVLLFAATADFGRIFYYSNVVASAAEAGVQYCAASTNYNVTNNCYTAVSGSNYSTPNALTVSSACTGQTGTYANTTPVQCAAANSVGNTQMALTVDPPNFYCLCESGTSSSDTFPTTSPSNSQCSGNPCTGGTMHEYIQLNTHYTYNLLFGNWPMIPSSIPINGTATYQVQ